MADDVVELAPQGGIAQTRDQGVGQEAPRHNQNGQAHAPAADLRQCQNADDANDDLVRREPGALLDDGHGVEGKVQERPGTQHHGEDVIPGDMVDLLMGLFRREHQKAQKYDPRHEGGQPQLFQPAGKQGHIQAEQGKRRQHAVDRDAGLSLPDPDVGFLVEFFHDRF